MSLWFSRGPRHRSRWTRDDWIYALIATLLTVMIVVLVAIM
jgi:hypothetical protein